jgi:hypothetical protein
MPDVELIDDNDSDFLRRSSRACLVRPIRLM